MQKRRSLLLGVMVLTLMMALFILPPNAMAITKVTPTPMPATDIEQLLENAHTKLDDSDFVGAVEDFTTVISMDDSNWEAYFFRAYAYTQLADQERAIDDYTRALDIHPYDTVTYTLRGDLYLFTGDFEQANLDYDQALYLSPRNPSPYAGKSALSSHLSDSTLADLYKGIFEGFRSEDSSEALKIWSDTIDKVDGSPIPTELGYAYYNRANLYIGSNDWNKALNDMNQAIHLQPTMQDYYMARGYIYSETDQLDLAAPDFYERMTLIKRTSISDTLDFGKSVSVDMDYGTVARLTFTGEAGKHVTISARDSQAMGVDPLLVLLDTNGNPIVGNDDGGGNLDSLINDYVLPADGTYTAVVSHANGGFFGTITISLK